MQPSSRRTPTGTSTPAATTTARTTWKACGSVTTRAPSVIVDDVPNEPLGYGEMDGHKAPVRLELRVYDASIGLLGDGGEPCVMRHEIAFECRPFVSPG